MLKEGGQGPEDGGRTDGQAQEACIYYKLTNGTKGSGELTRDIFLEPF